LGGIAAGAYFTASLIDLFAARDPDARPDHEVARAGYLIAFPLVLICAVLLLADLGRPDRFWHMLIDRNTWHPSIRWGSPMSVGAWGLTIFGLFAFISFLGTLAELGWVRLGLLQRLDAIVRRSALHVPFALLGAVFGFFLAGYTGVLLSVSNQPIWSDTHLLGGLFLASAASTGIAALALVLALRRRAEPDTIHRLERADSFAMMVEIVLLALFLLTVGTVARPLYSGKYAPWLYAGVVALGLLVPMALRLRPRLLGPFSPIVSAILVLAGGLVLRTVIVLAPQA
jgi:formate-dependent nitrite reductase membrane component NrfD